MAQAALDGAGDVTKSAPSQDPDAIAAHAAKVQEAAKAIEVRALYQARAVRGINPRAPLQAALKVNTDAAALKSLKSASEQLTKDLDASAAAEKQAVQAAVDQARKATTDAGTKDTESLHQRIAQLAHVLSDVQVFSQGGTVTTDAARSVAQQTDDLVGVLKALKVNEQKVGAACCCVLLVATVLLRAAARATPPALMIDRSMSPCAGHGERGSHGRQGGRRRPSGRHPCALEHSAATAAGREARPELEL
jgi:hypothetical protein